ncbi:extracellular solute-binding protein [Paenibacillus sp. J5C_2022]|uniref:extracellular solute-binding protein n=1 Tax=Paenibacillus sp. J5C2022 TaxID=2977129 RepID=UPI0021D177A5|nr:extracellular solute-binding protein [Paenibacillus sp. J5C2022]MCU6709952.1 extracellular solute-binding protein [Paenibacillus sp. J5C2022]
METRKQKHIGVIATLLAILLLVAACSSNEPGTSTGQNGKSEGNASGEGTTSVQPEGLPIVSEPLTLTMVAGQSHLHGEWKDKLLWKEAEKRTGIHVEWNLVPNENLQEKKNLLLASGELPDAFYGGGITTQDLVTYGEQGVFIPLNDLIDRYAPNFKKLLEQYPEIRKGLTAPDGNIYSLPKMSINPTHLTSTKLFLNQKWLDAVGLPAPKTTDELYEVLKAFKEKDPNGNGIADEIPLSGADMTSVLRSLAGAWGLNNRGISHANVDFDEQENKLRFVPADPKYKEMMQFLSRLYKEGLLDNEIFTSNNSIITAKIAQDTVGAFMNINTVWAGDKRTIFRGIPEALKGPEGDQLWAGVSPNLQVAGAFVITNENKHPEATMRWADYFIDGDGAVLYWMGMEGVTYEMRDGKYRFVEDIVNNPDGMTLDQAISRELVAPFTSHPIVREERFAWDTGEGLEEVMEAAAWLEPYKPKEVWPAFIFTAEENERIVALSNDIGTYVGEMRAQFVTGKVSVEEAWDEYISTIERMGLNDYMAIYEAAYERYKN